jgi:hypothetical protein
MTTIMQFPFAFLRLAIQIKTPSKCQSFNAGIFPHSFIMFLNPFRVDTEKEGKSKGVGNAETTIEIGEKTKKKVREIL